jgi:peptide/nickel transport system substrate-binding protein/oligopeptide transport system substrate-binding protein
VTLRLHFASIALAVLLLAACGCARQTHTAAYVPGPDGGPPRRGGHIVFVREEDPDYLDPGLSYGTYSAPLVEGIFHTLLDYAHEPGQAGAALEPDLAQSLPDIREGGTLYCFRIRPEARFGAPLHRHITAEDFKYAIERLFRVASPGVPFYRHIVGADHVLAGRATALPGVIARGDSLYIRLTGPDPTFIHILSMTFTAPVPKEIAEKYSTTFSQHTVATGPYQVAEFTPRRRVLLVRNPDYWGRPAWADTFELRLGVTQANAVALIKRGLVDGGMFEVPPAEFARLRSDSTWARQIDVADGLETDYLFVNVRLKPFDDVRVRQALAWAIDRRALLKTYSGKGIVAGEFCPVGMPGARPLGRYQGPDVARAKRLLAEAGYPHGFATRLYGYATEPVPRMLAIVQQQLADVGIRADLDIGEAVGYTSMASDTSRHVPFGFYAWTADYIDPSNFFDTLLNGHRITAVNNQNLSLYDDPWVNAHIEHAMTVADDSARATAWREIDERVMDEAPVIPLVHDFESRLYSQRLAGWYRHITRIMKIEDLYLKQPSAAPAAVATR